MTDPLPETATRVAFLGCGFISRVHTRHLRALDAGVARGYASRDAGRARDTCRRLGGDRSYASYDQALADPDVGVVVVALPPAYHREWTLAALDAGKHVLVEKPALLSTDDYHDVIAARDRAGLTVMVGENDHYKPLVATLRRELESGVIGDLVMMSLVTVADKPKVADDWRNDVDLAGGDAWFEEGIHWLHIAGSLGPRVVRVSGHSPQLPMPSGGDRRVRSMVVAMDFDNGAVGSILYSREVPSLLQGVRVSKLYGRQGVISFESNGGIVLVRGRGLPRVVRPGWRDIRGYQAMYRDLFESARLGRQPEMSLERALEDHLLMEASRRG